MSDIKRCDICKKDISSYYYEVLIRKSKVGEFLSFTEPRARIEICFNCLKKGITFAYSDFKKHKCN